MIVRKFSEAKPYEAPNHRGYSSLRLFGAEAGGSKEMIVGLSHFLPGGGAGVRGECEHGGAAGSSAAGVR